MQQNTSRILSILVILHSVLAREKNNRTNSDENAKEMFEHIDALNKRVQDKFGNDPRYLNMQKNVWSLFYDCINSGGITYCQEQNDNGSIVHIQNEKNKLEKNLNRTIEKIYRMKGEVRNEDINPEIERNKIKSDLASLVREVHDLLYKLFHSLVDSTGINCEEVEFEKDEIHEWIEIRNQKVDFIYPLCIATRDFCCLNSEITLDEKIENLLETIGFDMFEKFRHEFSREELEKIFFNNDPVQKLNIALEKLQAYATYFDAYNNYNAVLNVVFENKDSRYVPENLLSDTKEVQAEKSFDKVLKNVKLNEHAAKKMAKTTFEKSKWAMENLASLDLNQIKDHFFCLLHYHRLQEDLELFDSLFKTFTVRADVDGEGQLKIRQAEGSNFHQPLYDIVKNHFIAYYRLLLEIESNNCERELANAELMTIAIHLKKVLCEARMAIFALNEIEQRYINKNDTLIAKKLSDETFKAIAYAYALQKIGIDRAIYKEHFFMATTKTLKSYTSELKRMADIQTLNSTQPIAKNLDLGTPTLTENVVKIQTSAEEKDAVILESMSKSYNETNETLSILCNERRQRYMLKGICKETEQENRSNKDLKKETNDFDIYRRHLKMGPEAYQIAEDIKANSKFENEIGNVLHSDDLPNILYDLLNLIAKYELANAKLAKLEAEHLIEQEKTAAMSENTKRPDQLVAMAHFHFKLVGKIAELVMARHKAAKLLSDFWKLGEEMKKNEEYKSAETRDAATVSFDIKKFMLSKIQWGQNTRQSGFDFAVKRAIILIKKFMAEIEVKTIADNAAYIYNHASNYCDFVALLAEYILDCYSFKNKLLNDKEKQDYLTYLMQRVKFDGREIQELRDEIMHSINIHPDNITENRVLFPLLRELPLHKIASQNGSNIIVNTSQSTSVTTLKDQVKQDAKKPLVKTAKPVLTGSGKDTLHKSPGNLVREMVSVNDNSSRQNGLITEKTLQTSQRRDENTQNLKQPEDQVRENTPKLLRSTQVKKDSENISYEPLNNPSRQSRDANDHRATLPFADKKSTESETDVDLNESTTKPITKPRAEKAEPKKSILYTWVRKIAIGSIAALVIILLFGLGYYLWHYFDINK